MKLFADCHMLKRRAKLLEELYITGKHICPSK
jgi:hypothetical protein